MTMSLTGHDFDVGTAHKPARSRPGENDPRGRLVAVAVTVLLHVAVAAGLIAGVHVASLKQPPALMVHINLPQPKEAQDVAPPLLLQKPSIITAPPPEMVAETAPSPVMAQQQIAAPAPPPPAAGQKAAGESRENFLARLLAQLNRFKQYPRAARQAHIEGVVMLHFVMDADGKILSAEIAKSSGRPVLDAEALALIQRAQPLPALPGDFPGRTLDAVVPVEFSLNP